jgi:hypothetical protein
MTTTLAPGTTAPVVSVTLPAMLPAVWPNSDVEKAMAITGNHITLKHSLRILVPPNSAHYKWAEEKFHLMSGVFASGQKLPRSFQ